MRHSTSTTVSRYHSKFQQLHFNSVKKPAFIYLPSGVSHLHVVALMILSGLKRFPKIRTANWVTRVDHQRVSRVSRGPIHLGC